MMRRFGITGTSAVALAALLSASTAMAQTHRETPSDAAPAGTIKGDPIPKDLVAPGNGGVAGTGLGGKKDRLIDGSSGTGDSVSGPPGQGIDEGGTRKKPKAP